MKGLEHGAGRVLANKRHHQNYALSIFTTSRVLSFALIQPCLCLAPPGAAGHRFRAKLPLHRQAMPSSDGTGAGPEHSSTASPSAWMSWNGLFLATALLSATGVLRRWYWLQRGSVQAGGRLYFRMPLLLRAAADELANAITYGGTYLAVLLQPRFALALTSAVMAPNAHLGRRFGPLHRQWVDVFTPMAGRSAVAAGVPPHPSRAPAPMVLFVHGGAWSWGESWHFGNLARKVAQLGVVAAATSYRVYPYGDVEDMVEDVVLCLRWLRRNAEKYGGDPDRITLMGHSAGAHLIALAQLRLAAVAASAPDDSGAGHGGGGHLNAAVLPKEAGGQLPVSPEEAKAMLGSIGGALLASGVYDIARHYAFEASRPLFGSDIGHAWVSPMDPVCGGPPRWAACSPVQVARNLSPAAVALLPRQVFLHSKDDDVCPFDNSVQYAATLQAAGAPAVSFVQAVGEGHADSAIALMGGCVPPHTWADSEALALKLLRITSAVVHGTDVPGSGPVPPYERGQHAVAHATYSAAEPKL